MTLKAICLPVIFYIIRNCNFYYVKEIVLIKNRVKSKIFIDRRKRRRYYKVNTKTVLEDRNYEI